ncbi:hypothetical protein ACFV19_32525 [Streptomyces griseoluteus]|uniref:hypothetical protein n=1 Tax=Streptomyces griseoluteus TaxID=29306 RepID=UPI003699AAF2
MLQPSGLLEATMDARRLGAGLHLPQASLTDAALDCLHDADYDQPAEDWAEQAYAPPHSRLATDQGCAATAAQPRIGTP